MIYILLLNHWLADFVLQTDEMAKNKSKSFDALARHIGVYYLCLMPFAVYCAYKTKEPFMATSFLVFNAGTHMAIDYVTSRMSSKRFAKGDHHNAFAVIGFDQYLHVVILIATYNWLFT